MNILAIKKNVSVSVVLIVLAAVFSLLLAFTVYAGALTSFTATASNPLAEESSNYTIKFTTATALTATSSINVRFPSGFNVASVGPATTTVTLSNGTATTTTATTSVSGQVVTLDMQDDNIAVIATVSFTINNIFNGTEGSHTLTASTTDALGGAGSVIDEDTSTAFWINNPAGSAAQDTTAPVSSIIRPASGAVIPAGVSYTIDGTGTDNASVVSKVEVSLDGGTTWVQAKSTSAGTSYSWSYVWTNPAAGEYTIRARATDSAVNVESPGPSVSVTVGSGTSVEEVEESVAEEESVSEKPITEMSVLELQIRLVELYQRLLGLLQQLFALLQ